MTNHTNTYITFMHNKGALKSMTLITVAEMRTFLGIWIYMGVNRMNSTRDYWSSETCVPNVANCMTYNRFQAIKSNLHVYDQTMESDLDLNDRFRKVSPLMEHIRKKCNGLEQETMFSIDETLVQYKGGFAGTLRQYIKNKPHRFGFKIFNYAGSSGMIYDFLPYAGQSTDYNKLREDELGFGVGAKVVLNLSKSIDFPERSAVFFDNFFTGVKLVAHLKEYNLLSVGTLRQDRTELCPLLSDKNLKPRFL